MKLLLEGRFRIRHIRADEVLADFEFNNGICDGGVNCLWDEFFGATVTISQIATWYIGLIDNSPTPTLLNADTLASHTGWSENTAYTGTRKAWVNATSASARAKNSSSVSSFTMSGTATIFGLFICSATSGTSGYLWSTGAFPNGPIAVVSSDVLQCTYGVSGV